MLLWGGAGSTACCSAEASFAWLPPRRHWQFDAILAPSFHHWGRHTVLPRVSFGDSSCHGDETRPVHPAGGHRGGVAVEPGACGGHQPQFPAPSAVVRKWRPGGKRCLAERRRRVTCCSHSARSRGGRQCQCRVCSQHRVQGCDTPCLHGWRFVRAQGSPCGCGWCETT